MFKPPHKQRTWGFRFSGTDALALCVFLGAAGGLSLQDNPLSWLIMIAAGHFFLFCNVFRIVRQRELIWSALFILNVGVWTWLEQLMWLRVLMCQLPITFGLIIADMRAPGYHGIFAKRLNPRLNDYLEGTLL